jgi:hypothetical protein
MTSRHYKVKDDEILVSSLLDDSEGDGDRKYRILPLLSYLSEPRDS